VISTAHPQPQNQQGPIVVPSKEERKRRMDRLQELGKTLVELPQGKYEKLKLQDHLNQAIEEAKRLTSREAKRRQLQYIGSIIEHADVGSIVKQLRDIDFTENQNQLADRHALLDVLAQTDQQIFDRLQELDLTSDGTTFSDVRRLIRQVRKELDKNIPFEQVAKSVESLALLKIFKNIH
jgi:ribosome-associated protein